MKPTELRKIAKSCTWSEMNTVIEFCGLELKLVQDFPFCKMWEVKNSRELNYISNTLHSLESNKADVGFIYNN